jgi:hypothetical protein
MKLTRRSFLAASAGFLAMPRVARAAVIVDAAGRSVTVPERVERVFPAGPPRRSPTTRCSHARCSAGRAPTGPQSLPSSIRRSARGPNSAG